MPTCQSCGCSFPNRIKIEQKTHIINHRKFCLVCSPFKKKKGQHLAKHLASVLKLERRNNKKDSVGDTNNLECFLCGRAYIYDKNTPNGHTLSRCNSCNTANRRLTIKERAVDYKGGSCEKCGYSKCLKALVFHHVDPATKLFSVGGNQTRGWLEVKKELDKCMLLCSNCHTEVHAEISHVGSYHNGNDTGP